MTARGDTFAGGRPLRLRRGLRTDRVDRSVTGRRSRPARGAAVVLLGVLALAPAVAAAPLKMEVGIDQKYDDLALYVFDQATGTVAKKADFITEPYATLSYRRAAPLPTTVFLDVTGDFYARYSIQNYQTYRVGLRQQIAGRTHLALKYTLIPHRFFGDDVVNATAAITAVTRAEVYRLQTLQLSLDRDLTDHLNAAVSARYGVRDARGAFDYRDTTIASATIDVTYRPAPRWRWVVGGVAEHDRAAGGFNRFLSTPADPVPDDASHNQGAVFTSAAYRVGRAWWIKGSYTHRDRFYTTGQNGDRLHEGRVDHTNSALLGTTFRASDALGFKLSYEAAQRDSTQAYARFQEHIYTIGVNLRF